MRNLQNLISASGYILLIGLVMASRSNDCHEASIAEANSSNPNEKFIDSITEGITSILRNYRNKTKSHEKELDDYKKQIEEELILSQNVKTSANESAGALYDDELSINLKSSVKRILHSIIESNKKVKADAEKRLKEAKEKVSASPLRNSVKCNEMFSETFIALSKIHNNFLEKCEKFSNFFTG